MKLILRMTALPYEMKRISDPRKAPKGKLPYIQTDNHTYADSELILDFLKTKFGDSLDNALTIQEKSEMLFLESTFSDRLYWLMFYFHWQEETGWLAIEKHYFHHLPFFKGKFLAKIIRSKMIKCLYLQGTGRHTRDEILHMSEKTLNALSVSLGLNNYLWEKQLLLSMLQPLVF